MLTLQQLKKLRKEGVINGDIKFLNEAPSMNHVFPAESEKSQIIDDTESSNYNESEKATLKSSSEETNSFFNSKHPLSSKTTPDHPNLKKPQKTSKASISSSPLSQQSLPSSPLKKHKSPHHYISPNNIQKPQTLSKSSNTSSPLKGPKLSKRGFKSPKAQLQPSLHYSSNSNIQKTNLNSLNHEKRIENFKKSNRQLISKERRGIRDKERRAIESTSEEEEIDEGREPRIKVYRKDRDGGLLYAFLEVKK